MMTSIQRMETSELSKAKTLQPKNKILKKNQFKDKNNKPIILKFQVLIMKINQIKMIMKKSLNIQMKMIIIVDMIVNLKVIVVIIVENIKKEKSIPSIQSLISGNFILMTHSFTKL